MAPAADAMDAALSHRLGALNPLPLIGGAGSDPTQMQFYAKAHDQLARENAPKPDQLKVAR